MSPACTCIATDLLAAAENEGPAVVGAVLQAVVPGLPTGIVVALLTDLADYVKGRQAAEEAAKLQAAAATEDATLDASETAKLASIGPGKAGPP